MKFIVGLIFAVVSIAPATQNRWVEMDADDYASHARFIEYSGLFTSTNGEDVKFSFNVSAVRTTNAAIPSQAGGLPANLQYGSNDRRPEVLQDVIVAMELRVGEDAVRIPKAAYVGLLNPLLPATLEVLRRRVGIVVAFDGGRGEKHYSCRFVFSQNKLLFRQIRDREDGPVQVLQFN
ncbi:MAG: hypothetical protein H0X34_07580 [Chthoniobacterales bacterium]|jgi:hypothetical protein|nr:hypothetical protein [Chthoniobacterales bacterium]